MSSEQVPSGNESATTSGQAVETKTEDKVAYSTYQKVLSEKKKRDAEIEQISAKLKDYEQKDLEAKGKDKELIEALRKEKAEMESKLLNTVQAVASKTVSAQIAAEAAKHGCVDNDLLMKVIDTKLMQIDEGSYDVNQEDLKRELEKVMKAKPFLFQKPGPKINDLPLTNKNPVLNHEGKKKSIQELALELAKLNNSKP